MSPTIDKMITTKFGLLANKGLPVELVQKPQMVRRAVLGEVYRDVFKASAVDAKGNQFMVSFEALPGDQIDWTNYIVEPVE